MRSKIRRDRASGKRITCPPPAALIELPAIRKAVALARIFSGKHLDGSWPSQAYGLYMLINGSFSGANGCLVWWDKGSTQFSLFNDAGTAFLGPLAATLSNSQCTLNAAGTNIVTSGNSLLMTLSLIFHNPPVTGTQQVWMYVADAAANTSGWVQKGTFTLPPAGVTAFIIGANFPSLRNDFTGFVGMQFTVGSQPLTVNALGRIYVSGNSQTHTVKLVNVSTGADVPGAIVSVNMQSGSAFGFNYAALSNPVTLPAAASYLLVSQETSGGDQWYEYGAVTSTNAAVVNGAVFSAGGSYNEFGPPNYSYGPLSFLYQ